MKILRRYERTVTLENFADTHNLVMEICERSKEHWSLGKYSACFVGAWVHDGGFLVGACGDGATPEGAMRNYAEKISGKFLDVKGIGIAVPLLLIPKENV